MRIGELARACDVNPKTIRYYEAFGLLPKAARAPSGHRTYSERDLRRLQFIRRAKQIGLPLASIRQITTYAETGSCQHLRPRLTRRRETWAARSFAPPRSRGRPSPLQSAGQVLGPPRGPYREGRAAAPPRTLPRTVRSWVNCRLSYAPHSKELIAAQLSEIEARMKDLQALRRELQGHHAALCRPAAAPPTGVGCSCLDEPSRKSPVLPVAALVRRPPRRKS